MQPIIEVTLVAFASVYALWALFLVVMCLERARDDGKLTRSAMWLGSPFLYAGYLLDFVVNVVVMSILFIELPEELLVTARVSRHKFGNVGWRMTVAKWLCDNLLDPFDPSGCHCKKPKD